jgi:hypothetical protein
MNSLPSLLSNLAWLQLECLDLIFLTALLLFASMVFVVKKIILFHLGCDDRISIPYKFTDERLARLTRWCSRVIGKKSNLSGTFGYLLNNSF